MEPRERSICMVCICHPEEFIRSNHPLHGVIEPDERIVNVYLLSDKPCEACGRRE